MPWRLWLVAALAVTEPLLLGVWFDGENLVKLGGGAAVLANANMLLRIGSAGLLALVVIQTARQTSLHGEKAAVLTHTPHVLAWLGHAFGFGALVLASIRVFSLSGHGSGAHAPTPTWNWLLLWSLSALCTAATLALLVAPAHAWLAALRKHSDALFYALMIGVSTWLLGLGSDLLWRPLGGATLEATARLLDYFEPEIIVIAETRVIATPHFGVEVAPECSGFEGMGLMAAFLLVAAVLGRNRLRTGRVLALLPFAVAFMWLTNALRIAVLVWLGSNVSAPMAMGAFHSKAGWFLFCAVALALLTFINQSAYFQRALRLELTEAAANEPAPPTYNPTLVYLLPLLAQLSTALLTSAFAPQLDLAYGARIVTTGAALWFVRRDLPSLGVSLHFAPVLVGGVAYVTWTLLSAPLPHVNLWPETPLPLPASYDALHQLPTLSYWAWIVARVFGSVVVVPIAEELAFRGFLLPRLMSADFTNVPPRKLTFVALVGSSVVFGLLHEQWLAGTLCGVLFGLARWYRGRLGDAILAHALTNALLAVDVLARDHWHHWL